MDNDKPNMYVLNPDIENYINNLYPSDDPILDEMEKLAEELEFPIVGRLTGRLLYQIAMMVKPKKILELGSGFGYSAYWFSKSIIPTRTDDGISLSIKL